MPSSSRYFTTGFGDDLAAPVVQRASVFAGESLRICEAIESGDTVTTEAALKNWAAGQSAVLDTARTLGTRPEFQAALQFLFQRAMDSGIGDHDLSALVEVFAGEVELHPNDGS